MTKTHRERLLKLADLLDTVPVRKFDLGVWHNGQQGCQTVGCAVGWATTIPAFRRAGLRLHAARRAPMFKGHSGFGAAASFFGLDHAEAYRLFNPDSYTAGHRTRPKTVAKRIRRLVEAS